MYRLILLDDEEFVIKGIQKVYDLPEYGFEVAGTFTNPLDALEHLEELAPDLVITDVKMPAMDGLEFAGEVKKLYPNIEVVILSGYDDFSYAQAAVKLGVSDYLLKPIKRDDFVAMLSRMYDKIEEKRLRETSYQALEQLIEDNVVELVNRFYLRLAEDNYFDEHLYEAIKDRGLSDFKDEDFLLIKMDMGQVSAAGDYMSEIGRIIQEIEMTLLDYGKVFSFWSDESLYVAVYDLNKEQYEEICDSISALAETERFRGFSFSIGFSDIFRGLENLFFAYADCVRQIFFREANIDTASEAETLESREVNVTLPYSEIEKLFQAISLDNADGIDASLDQIYVIPEQDIPIVSRDYVSSITFLILLRIYQTQNRYSAEDEIVKREHLDLRRISRECPTLEDQKAIARDAALALAALMKKGQEGSTSKTVLAALKYIDSHFSENISLQEVADNINISKNYLCDIFKKEIGVTFINYVTSLRIDKAKWYLEHTDMKMYEVSGAVGYNDYAYFSQIFKKNTGVTLSSYRRNL